MTIKELYEMAVAQGAENYVVTIPGEIFADMEIDLENVYINELFEEINLK